MRLRLNGILVAVLAAFMAMAGCSAGQDGADGKPGAAGLSGKAGVDGDDGDDGEPGDDGDSVTGDTGNPGQACWDLNNNGTGDVASEDANLDGVVDIADCRALAGSLKGKVLGARATPVAGAIVYAVPASAIDQTAITAASVLSGAAEAHDEPLEDTVKTNPAGMITDVTGADGSYEIAGLVAGVSYYIYTEPRQNSGYLPGGTGSRLAVLGSDLVGKVNDLLLSSSTPADATYVGSTRCIECHSSYESQKYTAHRLGIQATGNRAKWQDAADFPDMDNGINKFTPADDYDDPGVSKVIFTDVIATGKFDKWTAYDNTYAGPSTVCAEAYLWKENASGDYKITIVNSVNPSDSASPMTIDARLTYGGAVYKQRYLVEVPGAEGLYPFLQYQGYAGTDANIPFDKARGTYRDYHLDWYVGKGTDATWCTTDDTLGLQAAAKNFEGACLSCHATGWKQEIGGDGKIHGTAVEDVNGEYDIDGDGNLEELNTGCEVCHGPGSRHDVLGKNIVSPSRLTSARSVQLCNRCHDRALGKTDSNLDAGNTIPVNASGVPSLPGGSRADYLANYTSRKGPAAADFWGDGIHSKSHHQQGPDHLKSKHYRNGLALLDCASCHDVHGTATGRPKHMLRADGDALCGSCHVDKLIDAHMLAKVGSPATFMSGATCTSCHMPLTSRTGAGTTGALAGPIGSKSQYWDGDLGSHLFIVPGIWSGSPQGSKYAVGTKGVTPPLKAMPVPYTNSCAGSCHMYDPSTLP